MNRLHAIAVSTVVAVLLMVVAVPMGASASARSTATTPPVTGVKVTAVTDTTVTLSWRHRHGRQYAGAAVRYLPGREAPSTPTSGFPAGRVGPHGRTLTVDGLSPGTTYSISVFARARSGHPSRPVVRTVTTRPGLAGVKSVVTNALSSCALLRGGRVDCWGHNDDNQLGGATSAPSTTAPIPVRGVRGDGRLSGVQSVVSDGQGFCALIASSQVVCWGDTLLRPNRAHYPGRFPSLVHGVDGSGRLSDVTALVGANRAFCALLGSGRVVCWGHSVGGQLGNGSAAPESDDPTRVVGIGGVGLLDDVTQLFTQAIASTVCAVQASTEVACWGHRPLGDGQPHPKGGSSVPVRVAGVGGVGSLDGVTRLDAAPYSICAVLDDGGSACWFADETPAAAPVTDVVSLAGTTSTTCALLGSGHVSCWRYREQTAHPVVGVGGQGLLSDVVELSRSADRFCAVSGSGEVDCWQTVRELREPCKSSYCGSTPAPMVDTDGDGALTDVRSLTPISGTVALGTGYYALLGSGSVAYWGAGAASHGALGNLPCHATRRFETPAFVPRARPANNNPPIRWDDCSGPGN